MLNYMEVPEIPSGVLLRGHRVHDQEAVEGYYAEEFLPMQVGTAYIPGGLPAVRLRSADGQWVETVYADSIVPAEEVPDEPDDDPPPDDPAPGEPTSGPSRVEVPA